MAARRSCEVVADTCVIWVAARGREPLRSIARCILEHACLTYAVLYDIEASGREWLRRQAMEMLGQPEGPRVRELERRLGRYGRWVREIGPADVMIALSAIELDAILATCDLRLFQFYSDQTGRRPIFIPVE